MTPYLHNHQPMPLQKNSKGMDKFYIKIKDVQNFSLCQHNILHSLIFINNPLNFFGITQNYLR
jgi:hypothetical protein